MQFPPLLGRAVDVLALCVRTSEPTSRVLELSRRSSGGVAAVGLENSLSTVSTPAILAQHRGLRSVYASRHFLRSSRPLVGTDEWAKAPVGYREKKRRLERERELYRGGFSKKIDGAAGSTTLRGFLRRALARTELLGNAS